MPISNPPILLAEPVAHAVTVGDGIELLNTIERKQIDHSVTGKLFELVSTGMVDLKPVAGDYKGFTFYLRSNGDTKISVDFAGRPFAVINSDSIVSPAPCMNMPEDTVKFWHEGTVDMILTHCTALVENQPLALA